jgi:hypothetical protein
MLEFSQAGPRAWDTRFPISDFRFGIGSARRLVIRSPQSKIENPKSRPGASSPRGSQAVVVRTRSFTTQSRCTGPLDPSEFVPIHHGRSVRAGVGWPRPGCAGGSDPAGPAGGAPPTDLTLTDTHCHMGGSSCDECDRQEEVNRRLAATWCRKARGHPNPGESVGPALQPVAPGLSGGNAVPGALLAAGGLRRGTR